MMLYSSVSPVFLVLLLATTLVHAVYTTDTTIPPLIYPVYGGHGLAFKLARDGALLATLEYSDTKPHDGMDFAPVCSLDYTDPIVASVIARTLGFARSKFAVLPAKQQLYYQQLTANTTLPRFSNITCEDKAGDFTQCNIVSAEKHFRANACPDGDTIVALNLNETTYAQSGGFFIRLAPTYRVEVARVDDWNPHSANRKRPQDLDFYGVCDDYQHSSNFATLACKLMQFPFTGNSTWFTNAASVGGTSSKTILLDDVICGSYATSLSLCSYKEGSNCVASESMGLDCIGNKNRHPPELPYRSYASGSMHPFREPAVAFALGSVIVLSLLICAFRFAKRRRLMRAWRRNVQAYDNATASQHAVELNMLLLGAAAGVSRREMLRAMNSTSSFLAANNNSIGGNGNDDVNAFSSGNLDDDDPVLSPLQLQYHLRTSPSFRRASITAAAAGLPLISLLAPPSPNNRNSSNSDGSASSALGGLIPRRRRGRELNPHRNAFIVNAAIADPAALGGVSTGRLIDDAAPVADRAVVGTPRSSTTANRHASAASSPATPPRGYVTPTSSPRRPAAAAAENDEEGGDDEKKSNNNNNDDKTQRELDFTSVVLGVRMNRGRGGDTDDDEDDDHDARQVEQDADDDDDDDLMSDRHAPSARNDNNDRRGGGGASGSIGGPMDLLQGGGSSKV